MLLRGRGQVRPRPWFGVVYTMLKEADKTRWAQLLLMWLQRNALTVKGNESKVLFSTETKMKKKNVNTKNHDSTSQWGEGTFITADGSVISKKACLMISSPHLSGVREMFISLTLDFLCGVLGECQGRKKKGLSWHTFLNNSFKMTIIIK